MAQSKSQMQEAWGSRKSSAVGSPDAIESPGAVERLGAIAIVIGAGAPT